MMINYKSDFKLRISNPNKDSYSQFVITLYSGGKTYTASFLNGVYTSCKRMEDGSILVSVNNHGLPTGMLWARLEYMVTDADYADQVCNFVSNEYTGIILSHGATENKVVRLQAPASYLKGPKGDPMKWSGLTADQKKEFVNDAANSVMKGEITSTIYGTSNYPDVFTTE